MARARRTRAWVTLVALAAGALACGSTSKRSPGAGQNDTHGSGGGGAVPGGAIAGVAGVYYGDGGPNVGATAGVGGSCDGYHGVGGGEYCAGGPGYIPGTGGYPAGGTAGVGGVYFGDGAGNVPQACSSPKLNANTGLVTCAEGYAHRAKVVTCEVLGLGDGGASGVDPHDMPRADGTVLCDEQPAKCEKYQYGYCDEGQTGTCQSGCAVDGDCGPGYVCRCPAAPSASGGVCQPTQCRTDADCVSGLCATFDGLCGKDGFACQAFNDGCATSEQCGGQICTWDPTTYSRHCAFANCPR